MTLSATLITYKSQTLTLKQWAEHLNMHYPTLRARYERGLLPPRLFAGSPKTVATTLITHNGQTMQLRHWAKELRIPYDTLRARYTRGVRPPELLQPKPTADVSPTTVMITYLNQTRSIYNWTRRWGIGFVRPFELYQQGERNPAILFNQHTDT